jgi:hypothetical protein
MNYTPGPWFVDDTTTRLGGPRISAEYPESSRTADEWPLGIADVWEQIESSKWTAADNARLIAAAPDLLEAAKAALEPVADNAHHEREAGRAANFEHRMAVLDALKAAIAKAEGREE